MVEAGSEEKQTAAKTSESGPQGRVISIGRSDCLCRAGIQGDIRTIVALGGRPTTVATVVTADDTNHAFDWVELPPTIIVRQMERILRQQGADCLKIGQLHSEEQIDIVTNTLERLSVRLPMVLAPVMASVDGRPMLSVRAASALKRRLLIHGLVLSVSVREAELLTGMEIRDEDMMTAAAHMLLTLGGNTVFVHSATFGRNHATDILATEEDIHHFDDGPAEAGSLLGVKTTLSAGIATGIAKGLPLLDSVIQARAYLAHTMDTLRESQGRSPSRPLAPHHRALDGEAVVEVPRG